MDSYNTLTQEFVNVPEAKAVIDKDYLKFIGEDPVLKEKYCKHFLEPK